MIPSTPASRAQSFLHRHHQNRKAERQGSSLLSPIGKIWNAIPKCLSLPIQTSLVLYTPFGSLLKGSVLASSPLDSVISTARLTQATAGTTALCLGTPKGLSSFFLGSPMNLLGKRVHLYEGLNLQKDPLPQDPEAPLTDLHRKVASFERIERNILPSSDPSILVDPADPIQEKPSVKPKMVEEKTNANLAVVIEKVSNFAILQAMLSASGIEEPNAAPLLLRIADQASAKDAKGHPRSMWSLFQEHYRSNLGVVGSAKAKATYLLLWQWTDILPKTVDAYLKNLLTELRVNLKENGEKRKKLINGILEDLDNFLEIYNGASETYANDSSRKGNLNRYRKLALDLHLPREAVINGSEDTTPEKIRMEVCRKLSCSMVDNFSPKIQFPFLEGWLNETIRKQLKETILPNLFLNVSIEGKEAGKQHNIPFFLALTKTLTGQLETLQAKLEEGSADDASSSSGIKNFEGIVKKLMRTIDLANYTTREELKACLASLDSQSEPFIDKKVRETIEHAIQKGFAVVFDYLSKQENTEELFALFFESLIDPLSGKMPLNDKEWTAIETEYKAANILLKQSASSLIKKIIRKAIKDQLSTVDRHANSIFTEHKNHSQTTLAQMEQDCKQISEKILRLQENPAFAGNIYSELKSLVSSLKSFENKERVKITLNQDPLPPIAELSKADSESILRTLHPIYRGANQLMDHCLRLQKQQQHQILLSEVKEKSRQLQSIFLELQNTKADHPTLFAQLKETACELQAISSKFSINTEDLQKQTQTVLHYLKELLQEQETLKKLHLLLSFREKAPFSKYKKEMQDLTEKTIHDPLDRKTILFLIEQLSHDPSESEKKKIWDRLVQKIRIQQTNIFQQIRRISSPLRTHLFVGESNACEYVRAYQEFETNNLRTMKESAGRLQSRIASLLSQVNTSQRELQLIPSSDDAATLGFVGGALLGGLASQGSDNSGMIAGAGGILGALAFFGIRRLPYIHEDGLTKFGIKTTLYSAVAAAILGTAAHYASEKINLPISPVLVGATAASAGFEYAAKNFKKQAVHTGVKVVVPKVENISDKAYEHLLKSEFVIDSGMKIIMKQIISLFPPKNSIA